MPVNQGLECHLLQEGVCESSSYGHSCRCLKNVSLTGIPGPLEHGCPSQWMCGWSSRFIGQCHTLLGRYLLSVEFPIWATLGSGKKKIAQTLSDSSVRKWLVMTEGINYIKEEIFNCPNKIAPKLSPISQVLFLLWNSLSCCVNQAFPHDMPHKFPNLKWQRKISWKLGLFC